MWRVLKTTEDIRKFVYDAEWCATCTFSHPDEEDCLEAARLVKEKREKEEKTYSCLDCGWIGSESALGQGSFFLESDGSSFTSECCPNCWSRAVEEE